jgi:hypothetical protein
VVSGRNQFLNIRQKRNNYSSTQVGTRESDGAAEVDFIALLPEH